MNELECFAGCPDAVVMLDGQGLFVASNPAADALAARGLVFRDLPLGRVEHFEPSCGQWFAVDCWPVPGGRMLLVREVTARKAEAAEAAELVRRIWEFETLLEVLPVGIGIAKDPQCRDIQINPAFSAMLAMPADDNASKTGPAPEQLPFRVYQNGVELSGDQLPMQVAAREARQVRDVELDVLRHDGTMVTELCLASPLFDEQHKVRGSIGVFLDITEWRQSEARYRFLAEALPQIIWIANLRNEVLYINSHWCQYTGLTLEQTQQGGWGQMIHPEDIPGILTTEGMQKWQAEYRLRRASDQSWRWHLARAEKVRAADGSDRWLGTALDINDRKQAEEERVELLLRTEDALAVQKQVEAQLLLLVEASSALIESPDSKQVLGAILKLAQRFVGADAYGVLRRRAVDSEWDVVATDGLSEGYMLPSAPGRAAILDGLSAPCPVEDVETSALMAHRKAHHRAEGIRSLLIVPLRTPGGTDGDIIFYYRTPHRFNELELRVAGGLGNLAAAALESAALYEKQMQLRRIAEAAQRRAGFLAEAGKVLWSSLDYEVTLAGVVRLAVPEIADEVCIYVTDQDGTLRLVAGPLLPADVAAVSAQTGTPTLLADLIAVPLLAPGRTLGAMVMKMAGGQREFAGSDLALAEDLAVRIVAAIANTQLYQESLEAGLALQKLNSELKRANEDLNQFAYSASHDLQEPLRMVAIYSQMLATEFGGRLGERGDLYIRYAVQGAKQMQMLVRDILAYTRAGDFSDQKITPVAVGLALGTVLVNLDAAIQETGAEIEAGDLPEVMVHEVHLVQLLQNLVGNALKYRGREKPKVRISAELEGDRWRISVQDNGIGIAPEYAEQVFGIFKRLHSAAEYPGTGVGLAICQKIVERYGGRIGVESVEGSGSVFGFTLPGA